MDIPFFYNQQLTSTTKQLVLDEATSRHVAQVLRMQAGEPIHITNGTGLKGMARIAVAHKKSTEIHIENIAVTPKPAQQITIAISPLKNAARYEWFLEKATEIGVAAIYPILCSRTERQHFRTDRMQTIITSAMLQSQQTWMPVLHQPIKYSLALGELAQHPAQKLIAHCELDSKKMPIQQIAIPNNNKIILIGPEGDFTPAEIADAISNDFVAVSLGSTRLRTETAGIVAATICCM
jgi:16S rRNA (uracil1498-N3)-methyltransferase